MEGLGHKNNNGLKKLRTTSEIETTSDFKVFNVQVVKISQTQRFSG